MPKAKPAVPDREMQISDLRDLRAFALAADLRSLTAAGRVAGETTATISRRITRIEAALGTTLLRRSSRGVAVTDAGHAYRERVGQALELLGDANAAAVRGRSTPSGQLRISVPPGLSTALAPLLAGFGAAYPDIRLIVHLSSRFVDLDGERFDVAVRATAKLADSSLVAIRVDSPETEGILVAAPSYLATHAAVRDVGELAAHRILALGETGAAFTLPLVHRRTGETVVLQLPVAVAGSDLGFLADMARHGAGITILPRSTIQRDLDDGRLAHILPSYLWPSGSLFILHRGGAFLAPKVRVFLEHVRAALSSSAKAGPPARRLPDRGRLRGAADPERRPRQRDRADPP